MMNYLCAGFCDNFFCYFEISLNNLFDTDLKQ